MGIALVREIEAAASNSNRFTIGLGDHLLRLKNQSKPRDRSGYISPSQVGGCAQWTLNQLRGDPQDNTQDPWLNPFFAVANKIHEIYQILGVEAKLLDPESIEQWVENELTVLISNNGPLSINAPSIDPPNRNGSYSTHCSIDSGSNNFAPTPKI